MFVSSKKYYYCHTSLSLSRVCLFCSIKLDKELKYDRQKLEMNRDLTQEHRQLIVQKVQCIYIYIC